MRIHDNALDLIGNTPLIELKKIEKELGLKARIVAKVEFFNPAGSVKDRIAKAMVEKAIEDGIITEGATLIEATSGNTGIGLASVAAMKGYKAIFRVFIKDKYKDGGSYAEYEGSIVKYDGYARRIRLDNHITIIIDDIRDIQIKDATVV